MSKKIKLLGMLVLAELLYLAPQNVRPGSLCWYECDAFGCRLVCLADELR